MKWVKWLGKQVRSDGGCRIRHVASLLRGCGKGSGCAAASVPAGNSQNAKGRGSWIRKVLMQGGGHVSTQNTQAVKLLDEVLAKLGAAAQAGGGSAEDGSAPAGGAVSGGRLADAIDREIAAQPLQTAVARVRQSEVVEQFRRELETQSLTMATVTAFLQMLQQVLPMLLVR